MPIKLLVECGPASLYGLVCIVWMCGGRGHFIICGAINCKFVAFEYGVSMHFINSKLCLNHLMGCTTGGNG